MIENCTNEWRTWETMTLNVPRTVLSLLSCSADSEATDCMQCAQKIPNNAQLTQMSYNLCGLQRVCIPQYRMHLSLTLDCQSLRRKTEVITQQLRNLQCTEVSGSKFVR